MKIVIAGGSGFLGSKISEEFKTEEIVVLSRSPEKSAHYKTVQWDGKSIGDWVNELDGADVLINLTGKSINCRFTEKNKALILNSRVDSTKILGEALLRCNKKPALWINTSGGAIYKFNPDNPSDENSELADNGFFPEVCKAWEQAFFDSQIPEIRKVVIRIPVVLGKNNGALVPLLKLVKFGLGGKQGSGSQKFSWIHEADFVRGIRFIIENRSIEGVVNMTSPNPVTNEELMKSLRRSIGVPFGIPSPEWLLRLGSKIVGIEGDLVLNDLYVQPKVLKTAGFEFIYPTLELALEEII